MYLEFTFVRSPHGFEVFLAPLRAFFGGVLGTGPKTTVSGHVGVI
ncbi:hypothetical protein [Clostridium sp. CF012]|nr:hypothetical protein [Clostridium sp. CF012]